MLLSTKLTLLSLIAALVTASLASPVITRFERRPSLRLREVKERKRYASYLVYHVWLFTDYALISQFVVDIQTQSHPQHSISYPLHGTGKIALGQHSWA